jgi:hypothetical protein
MPLHRPMRVKAHLLAAGSPVDLTTYAVQRGLLVLLDKDGYAAAQRMRAAVISGRDGLESGLRAPLLCGLPEAPLDQLRWLRPTWRTGAALSPAPWRP